VEGHVLQPHLWGIALAYMLRVVRLVVLVSGLDPYMPSVQPPGQGLDKMAQHSELLVGRSKPVSGRLLSDSLLKRNRPHAVSRPFSPVRLRHRRRRHGLHTVRPQSGRCGWRLMCSGLRKRSGQAGEWASVISLGGRCRGTAFGLSTWGQRRAGIRFSRS